MLFRSLHVAKVALAGFDGFENSFDKSYADISLPFINPGKEWAELNNEIKDMLSDFKKTTQYSMQINFITNSKYNMETR